MPADFSLTDLSRLADVTPRTIRYYVAQGLLPSPEAAGPATRYSEGHLARLRLIRRLQRDHLPLAEIRERLERMTDHEVELALAATGATPAPGVTGDRTEAVGYIRSLMEQARIEPTIHPAAARPATEPPVAASGPAAEARHMVARSGAMELSIAPPAASPAPTPSPMTGRSTWERLVITPDIEIHVRRPLKPIDNKRVELLARHARELFQDEP
jgi:DNA-binding transcriptional MerR regulator